MKVNWFSRQFSRFDLAMVKVSRPLSVVNTVANLSVAIVIGVFIFGLIFSFGFLLILGLGYGLHKSGFLMQTTVETFDQQGKELYQRQIRFMSANIAKCQRMSEEELEEELEQALKGLRL